MKKLSDIKKGDRVFCEGRYLMGITTVKRVTKTLVVLVNDSRYNRESGYKVGGDPFNSDHIKILTKEDVKRYKLLKLNHMVKNMIKNVVIPKEEEGLKQLIKILGPYQEKRKNK